MRTRLGIYRVGLGMYFLMRVFIFSHAEKGCLKHKDLAALCHGVRADQ
jgi:hypothetical protein